MQGNSAQNIEQQLSSYYDARYQYHQALDLNRGDEQAKKNLSLLEERIKEAEKRKEEEQQTQRTQQRQRQGQRKQRNRNKQQQNQMGQKPDQRSQSGSGGQPDEDQSPGDQQQEPSDSTEGGNESAPQDEATPAPKKDGQLREMAPSDQQEQMHQPLESKPGQMSDDEALGLLDSLKDEGDRIDLMRRKTERGVLRDW
jgi:Ca-activated chloride channel family protein